MDFAQFNHHFQVPVLAFHSQFNTQEYSPETNQNDMIVFPNDDGTLPDLSSTTVATSTPIRTSSTTPLTTTTTMKITKAMQGEKSIT